MWGTFGGEWLTKWIVRPAGWFSVHSRCRLLTRLIWPGAGAYELFLEIGGLVLASAGLLSVLERLWARLSGRTIAAQPGEGSADSA